MIKFISIVIACFIPLLNPSLSDFPGYMKAHSRTGRPKGVTLFPENLERSGENAVSVAPIQLTENRMTRLIHWHFIARCHFCNFTDFVCNKFIGMQVFKNHSILLEHGSK